MSLASRDFATTNCQRLTRRMVLATTCRVPYVPTPMVAVSAADPARRAAPGPLSHALTVMVVGRLLLEASQQLLESLRKEAELPETHGPEDFQLAARRYVERHGVLKAMVRYRPPPGWAWDEAGLNGDAYGAYAWGCYVAEVAVDIRTGEVELTDFVAAQEVGRVIHPVAARGQIRGGVAQGVGFALYEQVVWSDGVMANDHLADYHVPTSAEMPPVRVVFLEGQPLRGALDAKGLGELPIDGTAPAIVNAINDALGTGLSSLPALPERVVAALDAKGRP